MTRPGRAPATLQRLVDLASRCALVAALLAVASCAPASRGAAAATAGLPRGAADSGPRTAGGEPAPDADRASGTGWEEVDRLVDEQKLAAALEIADDLLTRAREAGDEEGWTRALVRGTQLRIALHGYERAVRFLVETPWPESDGERRVLDLFYGEALATYLRSYRWQIVSRERVDAGERVDLELWTAEQIQAEAHAAWLRVWRQRERWGAESLGSLAEFVEQNTYPARIRGTLRDAVTYLWVGLLADSSLWAPRAASETWKLDLARLIAGAPEGAEAVELADPEVHPLEKIGALLADLEGWHRDAGRPEAAFEARLERLRRLGDHFHRSGERRAIRAELERALERLGRRFPWWSVGRAELAERVRAEEAGDGLARAREIARQGALAHPDSVGGRRCRRLVAEIEAPDFTLGSMESDGPGRRSILVEHRNLAALHFRAYRLDLERAVTESRDYHPLPGWSEVEAVLRDRRPDAAWRVELPPTPDFRSHRTYVTPPLETPGLWVVAASARADFADRANRVSAVHLVVGDLVLLTQWATPGADSIEVTARSGASGRPFAGVDLGLWLRDYRGGHRRVATAVTGADGTATFSREPDSRSQYFVIGRAGEEVAVETSSIGFGREGEPLEHRVELVYTDRTVYRPFQTVHWKVVAYAGELGSGSFRSRPGAELTVELVDPNGEAVVSRSVTANEFGSAAGELQIPSGRPLGGWQVRADGRSAAAIRVEEYKRPTFEVELRDPAAELRLNRPAEIGGEGRYYFGLPVAGGEAEWRVVREPLWIAGWGWGFRGPAGEPVTVAAGRATLDAAGAFAVRFTPEADERDADEGIGSYHFRLSVDVTDRGGETRSAERAFRIGFAAVEATIRDRPGFLPAGEPVALELVRTDLEGSGRAGRGEWRLHRLEQPPEPLLPAEVPEEETPAGTEPGGPAPYRTPGDRLRPRWSRGEPATALVRRWKDGPEIARGQIAHGDRGVGKLALPALAPGAYRLRYSTEDSWGSSFELSTELVVSGAGRPPLALAAALLAEREAVPVGGTARFLVHSGLEDSVLVFEVFRAERRVERRVLEAGREAGVIELPVGPEHRGGFSVRLTSLRDHQLMTYEESVAVPWDDRRLQVRFASFRDRMRPGARETWTVEVSSPEPTTLAAESVELLAYMYDRSLDLFAPHLPPAPLDVYPRRTGTTFEDATLGSHGEVWGRQHGFAPLPEVPELRGDRLELLDGYAIGGPGARHELRRMRLDDGAVIVTSEAPRITKEDVGGMGGDPEQTQQWISEPPPVEMRSDFAETAFWLPHLVLGGEGTVSFSFTVPDSVTEWSAWAHALTTDLAAGSASVSSRSVQELMVRPYLPRFLREGDRAEVRVAIDNAGEIDLDGRVRFELVDPESGESRLRDFGLDPGRSEAAFSAPAGGGTEVRFPLQAPFGVGEVAVRVTARAGDLSDGELRPLPLLPGRVHLVRSRFAALSGAERRVLAFPELAAADDPSLRLERLAVTVDGQLFAGVLGALPYLIEFPYECTEQTLNRFLSTGIVSTLYERYPAVERLARELSARETRLEAWDRDDPNRRLALEETPWLAAARGGGEAGGLVNVLDSRIAAAERTAALAELERAQTSLGGFPWWPGGPPSPYMTIYLLQGFSRALEFGVEVPRGMVERAWGYLHRHWVDELARRLTEGECCVEIVTFLNYVLSSYPDASWTGGVFDADDRERMLAVSFRHWRRHPPLLKAQLALTLARAGRADDAKLVFDSVLDSARTTPDEGTFWAPEERAWLWYNDTVETHAFALSTLAELAPDDPRRDGLVQWLFLNKKLNQWKSTRATAEVVYALVRYLDREGRLLVPEEATVTLGGRSRRFDFAPGSPAPETAHGAPLARAAGETGAGGAGAEGEEAGRPNQWVLAGDGLPPAELSEVTVETTTAGPIFASATWHFSTEDPPREGAGDLFRVERRYFRRFHDGRDWALAPLDEGRRLEVGDEVEVRLSIESRHAAEYVHLRDPRGAGFEPAESRSGYRWDLGIVRYEEIRDSGAHFFFEWLPAGKVTLVHRLRAAVAGTFRVGPATLQSMYAPEFAAYSGGATLEIEPGG